MADKILEFYIYGVVLSSISSILTYNFYFEKLGLDANPNEPTFLGMKPWTNPITVLGNNLGNENLSERSVANLKRLKVWLVTNLLLLFVGTPILAVIQITISNMLR